MHIFMPMLKERFIQLLPDHSSDSVLIQKQIFKILYALFQVMSHLRMTTVDKALRLLISALCSFFKIGAFKSVIPSLESAYS